LRVLDVICMGLDTLRTIRKVPLGIFLGLSVGLQP
jgi:hypothetical protein